MTAGRARKAEYNLQMTRAHPNMDQAAITRAYKSDYGSAGKPKFSQQQKIAKMMAGLSLVINL